MRFSPSAAVWIWNLRRSPMRCNRIRRRLLAIVEPVVPDDLRDANPILLEDRAVSGALHLAMLFEIAPLAHRFLVAPERQRQDFSRRRQALEALARHEAVDVREQRPQPRGCIEIGILLRLLRDAFE